MKDDREFYDNPAGDEPTPVARCGAATLMAKRDKQGYWQVYFSPKGRIPAPLEGSFTSFSVLKSRVKMYVAGVI